MASLISYLDSIERALAAGEVVLIENLEETVDPVLGPLLSRETIKKGRYCKAQWCLSSPLLSSILLSSVPLSLFFSSPLSLPYYQAT